MSADKLTKLYISLDSLLDTRLGTLTVLNAQFAFDVSTSEAYYLREEDLFATPTQGALKKETFAKVAKAKQALILRNSLSTRILEFVDQLMHTLFYQALNTPYHSGVAIDVNTYPYVLSDEEQVAMLESLVLKLKGRYTINLIHKSNEELHVDTVRETYRAMVMYHYHEWLNMYDAQIKKKSLKDNTGLFVPRLYQGHVPSDEELVEFAKHRTDPFSFLQRILMPFVLLQYLPVALYSAATPANKPHYAQIEG